MAQKKKGTPTGQKKKKSAASGAEKQKKLKTAKKTTVKKRFYIFIILVLAIVAICGYFGMKALNTDSGGDDIDPKQTEDDSTTPGGIASPGGVNASGSALIPGTTGSGLSADDVSGGAIEGQPVQMVDTSYETDIYNAVYNSYYISPIGQTKAAVAETFGPITRYEDWSGGIYIHKNFPETMYVSYMGATDETGMPLDTSICNTVEISLGKIVSELQEFTPITWGTVNHDETGNGWTDYFYNIAFSNGYGYTMTVYCDETGLVEPDTHVVIRLR